MSSRRVLKESDLFRIAKQYKTREELRKEDPAVHGKIYKLGLAKSALKHMSYQQKPNNYWSIDRLKKEAQKYKYIKDFRQGSPGAFQAAQKKGLLDKIGPSLIKVKKPNGYWTKKRIFNEARSFLTLKDFRKENPGAYGAALELGLFNELRLILKVHAKPAGYWTLSRIHQLAKKCSTRSEFREKYPAACQAASRKKLLVKVCRHMRPLGNRNFRGIYIIEFEDKTAYVGLTHDFKERLERHRREKSKVGIKIDHVKHKVFPPKKYVSKSNAIELERKLMGRYRRLGWQLLNVKPGGSLGGNTKIWSRAACLKVAKKCSSLKEFRKKYPSAYGAALKNGWWPTIRKGLKRSMTHHGYWTKKRIIETAKKFKTRSEFKSAFPSAYAAARRKKILIQACRHMEYSPLWARRRS